MSDSCTARVGCGPTRNRWTGRHDRQDDHSQAPEELVDGGLVTMRDNSQMEIRELRCCTCKSDKIETSFGLDVSRPSGRAARCKACLKLKYEREEARKPKSPPNQRAHTALKVKILDLHASGSSYSAIVSELGCTKSTISYHLKAEGHTPLARKVIDWADVQLAHDSGDGVLKCCEDFGFTNETWYTAVRSGKLVPRDLRIPISELFIVDQLKSPSYLKRRALQDGLVQEVCYSCGLGTTWNGKPIVLWLDHENGDGNDWRRENLRMVCPNCDSQSDTYCGRNVDRSKQKPSRHLTVNQSPHDLRRSSTVFTAAE